MFLATPTRTTAAKALLHFRPQMARDAVTFNLAVSPVVDVDAVLVTGFKSRKKSGQIIPCLGRTLKLPGSWE